MFVWMTFIEFRTDIMKSIWNHCRAVLSLYLFFCLWNWLGIWNLYNLLALKRDCFHDGLMHVSSLMHYKDSWCKSHDVDAFIFFNPFLLIFRIPNLLALKGDCFHDGLIHASSLMHYEDSRCKSHDVDAFILFNPILLIFWLDNPSYHLTPYLLSNMDLMVYDNKYLIKIIKLL